ncbi:fibrous sheath CABYR-binding protein [Ixodes scapularis]
MSYKNDKSSGHVCAVVGCRNNQKKRKRLEEEVCHEHSVPRKACGCTVYRFHRFPVDARLRQKWLAFLNRKGFVPSHHTRLCSEHFIDGDRASWPVPIHRVAPKRRAVPRKRATTLPGAQVETVDRRDKRTTASVAASQVHNIVFWQMATGENVEVVSIRGRSAGIADEEFLAKVNLDDVRFSVRANSAVASRDEANPTTVGRLAEEREEAIDFCQTVYEEPQLHMPRRCTQRQGASEDDQQHVPSIVSSYSLAAPHKLFPPVPEPDEVVTGDVSSEDLWQPVDRECPAVIKKEQEEPPSSSHETSLQKNLVVAKDPDNLLERPTTQESPVILKQGQVSESVLDESKIQKTVVIMKKELGPGGLRHYTFQEFPVQQSPALPKPTQQYPAEQIPARQTLTQQILAQHILARKSPAQQVPAQQVPAQQIPPKQVHTQLSPAQQILAHQSLALQNLAQQSLGQEIPVQQIPAQHIRIPQIPPEQITAQQSPAQQIPTRQSPDSAQQIPSQQDPAQQSLSKQRLTQESSVQESPAVAEHTPEPVDQHREQASSSAAPGHNVLRSLLNAPSLSSTLKDQAARWGFAGLSDHGYCKSGPSELRRRVKEATVREALAQLPWWVQCTMKPT